MKTIKRVVLKEATKLSQEEMKQVFGGSATQSGVNVCGIRAGKDCKLYIQGSNGLWLPYDGKCKTIENLGWYRCACVAGDYASDPDKTHYCVTTGSGS